MSGPVRHRVPRPAGERAKKPTDEDTWEARLMNSIRAQLKATRERQGMTFDTLAERCKALGYPLSRVVLSKIEAGYRPHISVPELVVLTEVLGIPSFEVTGPSGLTVSISVTDARALARVAQLVRAAELRAEADRLEREAGQ